MEILKYLLLAVVQGLTETIPVSSSGHLMIIKKLISLDVDFNTIAILTNFGSLIAILIIFWKDIVSLINSFFKYLSTKETKYKVSELCPNAFGSDDLNDK